MTDSLCFGTANLSQHEDEIRCLNGLKCALHTLCFYHIFRLANAGGIEQADPKAVYIKINLKDIARRAGDLCDDGNISTGQRIQQRRFPAIGRSSYRNSEPVADDFSEPCASQMV